MIEAQVVIELLPQDVSAEKLLCGLEQELRLFGAPSCKVTRKPVFTIAKSFEDGAALVLKEVVVAPETWSVYIAPRYLELLVNNSTRMCLTGTLIAMARSQQPVALFLHVFTTAEVPSEIRVALKERVDRVRESLITGVVAPNEKAIVEGFNDMIQRAYLKSFDRTFVQ